MLGWLGAANPRKLLLPKPVRHVVKRPQIPVFQGQEVVYDGSEVEQRGQKVSLVEQTRQTQWQIVSNFPLLHPSFAAPAAPGSLPG